MARDNSTNVRITATDETRGAVASARAGLGGLADTTNDLSTRLGGLGSMLAGGALAGGLAALGASVRNSINSFDSMGKEAQRLGLSVEALSRLTYAAKLSDLGAEQVSMGLRQLAKTMDEQPAKLQALGIAVKDADGQMRSTDAVLADIADRFAGARDGAEKTAAAMSLFGEAGAKMIPMLNGGSASLRELGDEADNLGVTISTQMAEQAAEFNDNLTRLAESSKGLGYSIANSLMPALSSLSEWMVEFSTRPTEMDDPKANPFATWWNETALAIDRARLKLFEFIGASKLAALAQKEVAASEARINLLATNSLAEMAQEGEAQFAAETAGAAAGAAADTLPSLSAATKTKTAQKSELDKFNERIQAAELADYYRYNSEEELAAVAEKNALLSEENQRHLAELEFQNKESRERILADYMVSADASQRIAAARIQWEKMAEKDKASFLLGEAQSLTAGLATVSKAAFNANKAAAIAQTTITTYESAQKAFNAYAGIPIVGPVIGAVAAAGAIAMGLARIKAIKSTQFGGGAGNPSGAGGIPSLTGGIAAAQQQAVEPLQTAAPPLLRDPRGNTSTAREVRVVIQGDGVVSQSWVRDTLIPSINEAVGAGVNLSASAS